MTYDAAGDTTDDGTTAYTYDAEGRVTGATNTTYGASTYVYDADGRRVQKTTSAGGTVNSLYDLEGREVTQISSAGAWTRGEVYAGGRHLATYTGTGGSTYFIHADWLGTERARSALNDSAAETCTSLPFGDWLTCSASDVSPMHFTGKEHDWETGLENFGARYDASSMGRFMTPDWSDDPDPVPSADLGNPQTLNLYGYVADNPTTDTDPDGHDGCGGRGEDAIAGSGCISGVAQGPDANNGVIPAYRPPTFSRILAWLKGTPGSGGSGGSLWDNFWDDPNNPFYCPGCSQKQRNEHFNSSPLGALLGAATPEGEVAEGAGIISSIGKDAKLVNLAEEAGESVQRSLDNLVKQLGEGNTNPGIGTKSLGDGISYARARDGARVFFRQQGGRIEILAKASKANEAKVIARLRQLY